jgi:superfamily II helicase
MVNIARKAKPWNAKNHNKHIYHKQEDIKVRLIEDSSTYVSSDNAGRYEGEHFCKNCPEYWLWEEYKAQKHDVALDNSPFSAILH